ncbi:MAG: energy transducer TonB [Candidatus Paceibacterota bacterium]
MNKSSGSLQLDEQALQAARNSAPMAPPPRQMTVTLKVAFTHDW